MLLALWSPKGGSGTSVVAAALALVSATRGEARLVDLAGDQPAILGLPPAAASPVGTPAQGLAAWLAVGPSAPTEWLGAMATPVVPHLSFLPRGQGDIAVADAAAGAALGVALGDGDLTVVDAGRAAVPAARALVEVADTAVVVLRPCYLALRRAVGDPCLRFSSGAILVEDPGRALDAADVTAVLGLPVVGRIPVRPDIARAVDAGVLRDRLPPGLSAPLAAALARLGDGRTGSCAA